MPFVIEIAEGRGRLVLTGAVGIREAVRLHAALRELAGVPGEVVVDDTRVVAFDVTLLQLLVAFDRARGAAGAPTRTAGGPPSARLATLTLTADPPR